jgi:hypothetical protein
MPLTWAYIALPALPEVTGSNPAGDTVPATTGKGLWPGETPGQHRRAGPAVVGADFPVAGSGAGGAVGVTLDVFVPVVLGFSVVPLCL